MTSDRQPVKRQMARSKPVAATRDSRYTDAHCQTAPDRDPDGSRRHLMFKKSEETEWTRFSKALSSRDREESEESA